MHQALNQQVRRYWEREACGTAPAITGPVGEFTPAWFARIEEHRYAVEPMIHAVAQFTRHRGKKLLEIGVGAGTDHLQWSRAGCECWGVDLTDRAIETTTRHLAVHGLSSNLQRLDAETLPFADASFDLVYSWGVLHHAERPELIVREIARVLRPGGQFIGMLYHRRSLNTLQHWARHALLAGRPWRSFRDVIWHHMESVGTKCYEPDEVRRVFSPFAECAAWPLRTVYDTQHLPRWLGQLVPDDWGWFLAVRAVR
jgi:SAM-dependent methyltransferase